MTLTIDLLKGDETRLRAQIAEVTGALAYNLQLQVFLAKPLTDPEGVGKEATDPAGGGVSDVVTDGPNGDGNRINKPEDVLHGEAV